MRLSTAVLSAVTLAVGVGGGSVAYTLASSAGEPTASAVSTGTTAVADEGPATIVPGTRFRWAPCEPPAVLRGNTCVTTVVRTVVLPGTAVAATTGGSVAAAPAVPAAPTYQDDDEGYDDEGYDDEGYEDEDEGDDEVESDEDEGGDEDEADEDEGGDDEDEGGDEHGDDD